MSDDDYNDETEEDEVPQKKKDKKKKDKIIWSRDPKWNDIFGGDIFKNFDASNIEKIVEKLMEQFHLSDEDDPSKGPMVWGFSMSLGSDKKPVIRQFGNINPQRKKKLVQETREPLIDIIDEQDHISIIAEIPGVEKSDINLNTTEFLVVLSVKTLKRKYFKEIPLPAEVIPASAKARYKNGILEVKIKKKGSSTGYTPIQID